MSKKKAVGGSTMTLKDFHGGSIPSDLPLPSAPGLSYCLDIGHNNNANLLKQSLGRHEIFLLFSFWFTFCNLAMNLGVITKKEEHALGRNYFPGIRMDMMLWCYLPLKSSVFGGARSREMVLKERGIDYVSSESHDAAFISDRTKPFPKNERLPSNATTLHGVKSEDVVVVDPRNVKKIERGDQRVDARNDSQKRNWRNDNPRNVKDPDRQQPQQNQQQPLQER
ncbi:hypothetical protein MLD38_036950 [Melastoma candidum]|uniref:Uncharacterized protein n=1 Tax=Melastoma candidum TaxID=119954 RepID=A0ACB9LM93_9MYRT|nr:hypothetical protein MLD38_036950 [Melastoma candidum]